MCRVPLMGGCRQLGTNSTFGTRRASGVRSVAKAAASTQTGTQVASGRSRSRSGVLTNSGTPTLRAVSRFRAVVARRSATQAASHSPEVGMP